MNIRKFFRGAELKSLRESLKTRALIAGLFSLTLCGCEYRHPEVRLIENLRQSSYQMSLEKRREHARIAAGNVLRRYESLHLLQLHTEITDWPAKRHATVNAIMGHQRLEAELIAEHKLVIRLNYNGGMFREHRLPNGEIEEKRYTYVPPQDGGTDNLFLLDGTAYGPYACMWGSHLSSWFGDSETIQMFQSAIANSEYIGSCVWNEHLCDVYLYELPLGKNETRWEVFYVNDDLVVRRLTIDWPPSRLQKVAMRIRNYHYSQNGFVGLNFLEETNKRS